MDQTAVLALTRLNICESVTQSRIKIVQTIFLFKLRHAIFRNNMFTKSF